jgi:hypothetical protein
LIRLAGRQAAGRRLVLCGRAGRGAPAIIAGLIERAHLRRTIERIPGLAQRARVSDDNAGATR